VIVIEALQKGKHQRLGFSSGKKPLDRFLLEHAHQAVVKGLFKTYVAVDEVDETIILGYYTVTISRLEAGEIPSNVAQQFRLPETHGVPIFLVARLAVSQTVHGRGLGSTLLMDALARCARASGEIGGVAVVVDAMDDEVVGFYANYGFQRLEPGSLKMFIPMATVRGLVLVEPLAEQREAG
jgi:GNAT superfamily N-acetyltransferase